MSAAKTLRTDLNCLEGFNPILSPYYKEAEFVLLGNLHPLQQMQVINQLEKPKLIAIDTMNLWIEHTKKELIEVIRKSNMLIINDSEARELFQTPNLVQAAKKGLSLGLKYIVIKKGEHGAVLFGEKCHFSAPGYPLEVVKDPTGCGDAFAGGLMGYIANKGDFTESDLRKAIIYGSACAAYTAEDFGLNKLRATRKSDIEARFKEFKSIRQF